MRSFSVLSLLLLLPAASPAQGAAQAARTFLEARARHDWAAVAEFADSAGLAAIRAVANKTLEQVTMMQQPQVREALERAGAGAPLKMLDATTSMLGGGSLLRFAFAGVSDTAELRSLSDRELVARWFEARDPSHLMGLFMGGVMREMIDRSPRGEELRAEINSTMRDPVGWEMVGVVEDRSQRQVSHVIYRAGAGATTGVLSFRSDRGRWYLASLDPADQVDQLAKLEMTARQSKAAK